MSMGSSTVCTPFVSEHEIKLFKEMCIGHVTLFNHQYCQLLFVKVPLY